MAHIDVYRAVTRIALPLGLAISSAPSALAAQIVSAPAVVRESSREVSSMFHRDMTVRPPGIAEPKSSGVNVLAGAALGALVGGIVGPITGQIGDADELAAAVIGAGVGAVSGGIVVGAHIEDVTLGAAIGFLPGFAAGALLGAAASPVPRLRWSGEPFSRFPRPLLAPWPPVGCGQNADPSRGR
jgi:uncharacterized protein YcfJ